MPPYTDTSGRGTVRIGKDCRPLTGTLRGKIAVEIGEEELLTPFNPITTLEQGLFHFEYRTWPTIAVREALMNAFCHRDLRLAGLEKSGHIEHGGTGRGTC